MEDPADRRPTLRATNIPFTVTAHDVLASLEKTLGPDTVFAVEIVSEHKNWSSRGYGRIQFATLEAKARAQALSAAAKLFLKANNIILSPAHDDPIPRPIDPAHRLECTVLRAGFLVKEDRMRVLESWGHVRAWVMPERKRVEFWVRLRNECYKMEIAFDNIVESVPCSMGGGEATSLLLKLKYGPKIYRELPGPVMSSRLGFGADRYHVCKEDFDFIWARTTDFSELKSIGHSTSFLWEIKENVSFSDICMNFPYFNENKVDLMIEEEDGGYVSVSDTVPLVKGEVGLTKDEGDFTFVEGDGGYVSGSDFEPLVEGDTDSELHYDLLFQLNALVHSQKISLAAAQSNKLIKYLCGINLDTANAVLQKLHKLGTTCYDPLSFVKLHGSENSKKRLSAHQRLVDHNVMSCHRALITPSKIYCLGPELEKSNYVVKNFAEHASDFMRVTFVDEDWSKLPANALSMRIEKGFFAKPYRSAIYHRILSILRDGIVIGNKRFEFLAFSASQLRSNSVWMFASNDRLKAEDIREWMGCFKKIRSVSKCAARMGQLFSSSTQIVVVPPQDVEVIPDIEFSSYGVKYCFSDGIGKISPSFARLVAQKCGLDHTPSAFQIRYGGYKGVIAVDPNSSRKLSLRSSMLKFESDNRMLNVTKWSASMSCFLNREIITLLTTLGIKDEAFEALQQDQMDLLGNMRKDRNVALNALEKLSGADSNNILVKMLLQGYEPSLEPYLSMMLQAQYENHLSELKSRCRIFVPKGRILVGCLDETGNLDYGQVYVRITMTKTEQEMGNQSFFRRVNETTCIVTGKVIVTKNPCLHPGDVRVLEAVYDVGLETKNMVDCLVFPQKGKRPHPNECSGGDLDGDLFFISWDKDLVPSDSAVVDPMNYSPRRPRIMDHDVTLEEIQQFFVDYMINDNLGAISTAHLVLADHEPKKALSERCLELADLHSQAVDFAKTGAPAEMCWDLKPTTFPDFMERGEKPMYISEGILGKLYRAFCSSVVQETTSIVWSKQMAEETYDQDLEVQDFETFLEIAKSHRDMYIEKMGTLMNYYEAVSENEILTGNLRNRAAYLQRDNRRYFDLKDRILLSLKTLQKEAKGWFESSCEAGERQRMASAWYHVTYHPAYFQEEMKCFSFPWIVGDILLNIKSLNNQRNNTVTDG